MKIVTQKPIPGNLSKLANGMAKRMNGVLNRIDVYESVDREPLLAIMRIDFPNTDKRKQFPQAVPKGNDWVAGGIPDGATNPLLFLPELAANPSSPVVVVEGEKKAAVLQALGIMATCSPMGGSNARRADWTPLSGRIVTIWPDNDGTGAVYLKGILKNLPNNVTVLAVDPSKLDLPEKGDVWNFVERLENEGQNIEQITAAVHEVLAGAKEPELPGETVDATNNNDVPKNTGAGLRVVFESLRATFDNPPPQPPMLIQNLMYADAKVLLSGSSKSRKTFLMQHLSVCLATGTPWFGHEVKRSKVLFINLELQPFTFFRRMHDIAENMSVLSDREWNDRIDHLNLRGQRAKVEHLCAILEKRIERNTYDLVVFDPLYKLLGDRSENDSSEMGDLLGKLETTAANIGTAFLACTHFAKGTASNKTPLDRASGSGVLGRDADLFLTMTNHEVEDAVTLEFTVRDFIGPPAMGLKFEYPLFKIDDDVEPGKHASIGGRPKKCGPDDVYEACGKGICYTEIVNKLMKQCKVSKKTAERVLTDATDRGIVIKENGLYLPSKPSKPSKLGFDGSEELKRNDGPLAVITLKCFDGFDGKGFTVKTSNALKALGLESGKAELEKDCLAFAREKGHKTQEIQDAIAIGVKKKAIFRKKVSGKIRLALEETSFNDPKLAE
jgi:hypothetical protein